MTRFYSNSKKNNLGKEPKDPSCRIWELVTTTDMLTEDAILNVINSHSMIKRYAYINHNKDIYTSDSIDKIKSQIKEKNPGITDFQINQILTSQNKLLGEKKKAHWHVVLESSDAIKLSQLSKWFNVSPNFFTKKTTYKGAKRNSFLDAIRYLTHEEKKQQELGKHLYPDTDIKSNFDFRSELDAEKTEINKYGRRLNEDEKILMAIRYDGLTLKQAQESNKILYAKNETKYRKARLNYIGDMTPPSTRINFYVEGSGGVGKGLMSRAIARSLYPNWEDDDIFFNVGAKGAAFEGYDGQPVLIWSDRRALDFIVELHGRGNVFNVFDTHPEKLSQNVKYASINLANKYNIVNGIQPFKEFLDGLAGEYTNNNGNRYEAEDKSQSYRRFPIIIRVREYDYDVLINKGFSENTNEYFSYEENLSFLGNLQKIRVDCGNNTQLINELEAQTISPIIEKTKPLTLINDDIDVDAIREKYKKNGQPLTEREVSDIYFPQFKELDSPIVLIR